MDIWSCGVIMFALLYGHLPFEDQVSPQYSKRSSVNVYQLYQYISKNPLKLPSKTSNNISTHAIEMLKGMLRCDPQKRFTLAEIFRHPWFANSTIR